jgi:DNA-binding transcriptional LysR family regulator
MATQIGWELYRSFLGVLKEGSLSGAARALGVAQPTIGRHVAALEKALRLALFTRSPTGLLPTEAALALRPHAEAMESTAAALERAAASQGDGIRGVVRITASDMIGVEVLPPIVGRLHDEHPQLKIELVLTNRVQDLLRREADIAVRMTLPRQEALIARRIGQIELGLHATQQYLARRGVPKSIADLEQHSIIGFDQPNAFIRSAAKSLAHRSSDRAAGEGPLSGGALLTYSRELFSLRSDNDLAQLAMIRCGAGIGMCQVPVARRDAALVRVLPRQISLQLETWITMHEDLRNRPGCRVTFEALAAGLTRHVRSLPG